MFAIGAFFVGSFYFMPAYFIAPSLFLTNVVWMQPEGALGWILVVAVYSALALAIVVISRCISERKKAQNKLLHRTQ